MYECSGASKLGCVRRFALVFACAPKQLQIVRSVSESPRSACAQCLNVLVVWSLVQIDCSVVLSRAHRALPCLFCVMPCQ